MPVTMKDIATLIGVSRQAVAAALEGNGGSRVSPETREKVLKLARELNYIPNVAARSLKGGRTKTIGILSSPGSPYSDAVFAEICQMLRTHGYNFLASDLIPQVSELQQACQSLSSRGVEGIIVLGAPMTPPKHLMPDLPIVFCRTICGFSDVDIDKEQTGFLGTSHLLEHGHEAVSFLGIHLQANNLRERGWRRALKTRGAGGSRIDLYSLKGSAEQLEKVLRREKVTALFCSNDFLAAKVTRCLTRQGWKVPDDIALVGCDGHSFIEYTTPSIATVIQPLHQIAERCVEMILDRIGKNICGVVLEKVNIAPKFRAGGSCGCPDVPFDLLFRLNCTGTLEKDYRLNFNISLWNDPDQNTQMIETGLLK